MYLHPTIIDIILFESEYRRLKSVCEQMQSPGRRPRGGKILETHVRGEPESVVQYILIAWIHNLRLSPNTCTSLFNNVRSGTTFIPTVASAAFCG